MKRYEPLNEDRRNLLPKTFDKWVNQEFGSIEKMVSEYDIDVDEYYWIKDQFNENDFESENEYKQAIKKAQYELLYDIMSEEYDNWLYKYYDEFKFPLTVYRVIDLKAKSIEDIANLQLEKEFKGGVGIYWTDGTGDLESYWSKGGKSFTIRANIKENDINWKHMLYANMYPASGEPENEIRLIKGTKIILTGIAEGQTINDREFEELNVMVKA